MLTFDVKHMTEMRTSAPLDVLRQVSAPGTRHKGLKLGLPLTAELITH